LALIRAPGVELALPPVIAAAGEDAVRATLEFFMGHRLPRNGLLR
jgi:hypothetical protein